MHPRILRLLPHTTPPSVSSLRRCVSHSRSSLAMERFRKMKMSTKVFKKEAAPPPSPPPSPLLPAVPRPGRRNATTGTLRHSRSLEDFVLPSKNHEDNTKKKKRYGLSGAPAAMPTHHRQISNPTPIPHRSGIDRWLAPEPSSNTPPFIKAGPNAVRPSGPIIGIEQPSNSTDPYYNISSRTLDKFPLPPDAPNFKKDQGIQPRVSIVKQARDPNATCGYATVRERGVAAIDDRDMGPPHVPRGWDFVQPQHIVPHNSPGWESEDSDDDNDLAYHTYHGSGSPSYPQIRPTQPLVIRKHLNPRQPLQVLSMGIKTTGVSAAAAKAQGTSPAKDHILKQNMAKPTTPDIYRSASDTSHYRKNALYENPRRPPKKLVSGENTNTFSNTVATASSSSHGASTGTLHMRTQSAQAAYDITPVAVAPSTKPSSSASKKQEKQQQQSSEKTAWYRPSPVKQPPTIRLRSGPVSHRPAVMKNKAKYPDYSGSFFED